MQYILGHPLVHIVQNLGREFFFSSAPAPAGSGFEPGSPQPLKVGNQWLNHCTTWLIHRK